MAELNNEPGGHRIQRVPPTERKGRVHSSTVTVAVMDPKEIKNIAFNDRDFKVEWYSGTGKGGQNRNKVQACCRLTHIPTNIVKTAQCRTREASYAEALPALLEAVNNFYNNKIVASDAASRKDQVGSGMRGDKRRTYRFQDNKVLDHETGKSARATDIMNGNFNLLW